MEKIQLKENINVLCLQALKFPDGIAETHHQLKEMMPKKDGRRFFGLSRPKPDGTIGYVAAAEQLDTSEADILGLQEYTIPEGTYYRITVHSFSNSEGAIQKAFELILQQADIDPNGFCLEWYITNEDVYCMVRIRDEKN